jgi:hypothetical protein
MDGTLDELLKFGVAGAVVILVIRELFKFLRESKSKPDTNDAGSQSTQFWIDKQKEMLEDAVRPTNDALRQLAEINTQMHLCLVKLTTLVERNQRISR